MVQTGKRAKRLAALLHAAGYEASDRRPPPRLTDFTDEGKEIVRQLYRSLGGIDPAAQFRPGAWDLIFEGGLVVELDEELHFNRYRAITLGPSWATALPWRESYARFAVEQEPACLAAARWGKRWTNPSCERMFGPADEPGVFGDVGAPRWKQRALYDAIKDLAGVMQPELRLVRLATVDPICNKTLGELLERGTPVDPEALRQLVEARST